MKINTPDNGVIPNSDNPCWVKLREDGQTYLMWWDGTLFFSDKSPGEYQTGYTLSEVIKWAEIEKVEL